MNRSKAEKRMLIKLSKLKPCPFCGRVPKIRATCDTQHSSHGSWGHYVVRDGCCAATSNGQTELFFCSNFKKPSYYLWWHMLNRMVDDWNRRV